MEVLGVKFDISAQLVCSFDKQLDRAVITIRRCLRVTGVVQSVHLPQPLLLQAERLAGRYQDLDLVCTVQNPCDNVNRVQQMLEIIQH